MSANYIVPLEKLEIYWESSGLGKLFDKILEKQRKVLPKGMTPIKPKKTDLARLHYFIRQRRAFTTIEFGVGYSTIVMAHALSLNKRDFNRAGAMRKLRNSRLFEHHVIDASEKWLSHSKKVVPNSLRKFVTYKFSEVKVGTHLGQLCHFYTELPNVIADFIYLDAPDPLDVKGSKNGLDFSAAERTVMSGDLLLMESCFLPGVFIVVDGRTNNARFLANNFKRDYLNLWDQEGDVTIFELNEPRLGPHNVLGIDLY